jgi:hypothetical protein
MGQEGFMLQLFIFTDFCACSGGVTVFNLTFLIGDKNELYKNLNWSALYHILSLLLLNAPRLLASNFLGSNFRCRMIMCV